MDCNSMMGMGMGGGMWPGMMMSAGRGGMGGIGSMNPLMFGVSGGLNEFMSGGLGMNDDDDDDDGVWDADADEDDPFAVYYRAMKKGKRKRGKLGTLLVHSWDACLGSAPSACHIGLGRQVQC